MSTQRADVEMYNYYRDLSVIAIERRRGMFRNKKSGLEHEKAAALKDNLGFTFWRLQPLEDDYVGPDQRKPDQVTAVLTQEYERQQLPLDGAPEPQA